MAVLDPEIERETVQIAALACLVRGSVIASAPSSAEISVQETADPVEHAEAAVAVLQAILMAFDRTGFVVDRGNLAYGDLLDCLIAVLARTEAEVAMELPYRHLVISDWAQAGLENVVQVRRPASQLDSDHRIHAAREPVPWYTSGKS